MNSLRLTSGTSSSLWTSTSLFRSSHSRARAGESFLYLGLARGRVLLRRARVRPAFSTPPVPALIPTILLRYCDARAARRGGYPLRMNVTARHTQCGCCALPVCRILGLLQAGDTRRWKGSLTNTLAVESLTHTGPEEDTAHTPRLGSRGHPGDETATRVGPRRRKLPAALEKFPHLCPSFSGANPKVPRPLQLAAERTGDWQRGRRGSFYKSRHRVDRARLGKLCGVDVDHVLPEPLEASSRGPGCPVGAAGALDRRRRHLPL